MVVISKYLQVLHQFMVYDAERLGVENTGDPMQADILLITGGVNAQAEPIIKQIYDQMPRPKVVVAVGVCACTGGVFKDCYNIKGGADTVVPVAMYRVAQQDPSPSSTASSRQETSSRSAPKSMTNW